MGFEERSSKQIDKWGLAMLKGEVVNQFTADHPRVHGHLDVFCEVRVSTTAMIRLARRVDVDP
jgi:hypothetical protein